MTTFKQRECGGCTMCCKLLSMPELNKAAGQWCEACDIGKGCSIYLTRPAGCHDFQCMWLQDTGGKIPDEFRPDRIKIVAATSADGQAIMLHVDTSRIDNIMAGRVGAWIRQIATELPVILLYGDQRRGVGGKAFEYLARKAQEARARRNSGGPNHEAESHH